MSNAAAADLAEELDEATLEEQARDLRAALDHQMESIRSLSLEEQLEMSEDEQLTQLLMVVSQYDDSVLKRAILMTNTDSNNGNNEDSNSYSGRLPLHLACDTNAPLSVIRFLLEQDTAKQSIQQKDKWGDLPIHTACSRKDVEVVRLLLESDVDKTTVLTKDNHGALPIHMACRYNAPVEVIQLLLDNDLEKKSLHEGGMYDQLPLHVACRCNMAPDSIRLLLQYDSNKSTLLQEDNAGRLPLHVAFLRNNHVDVIRQLLEAMLVGRIERVGLEKWKHQVHAMLNSLATHERDFNTSDKLDMTKDAIRNWMERAFLLEMALWKETCLSDESHHYNFQTMLQVDSYTEPAYCAKQYKQDCRIKSGADIIVPHVLAFIDNEPVEQLLEEIANR